MADRAKFSPTDTYVLDDTAIKKTEKMRMTGILRDLDDEEIGHLEDSGRFEPTLDGYTIELSLDDD